MIAAVPMSIHQAQLLPEWGTVTFLLNEAIEKLKAKGFKSPYLRTFVVARVNPLRFMKGSVPPMDELLPSMAKRARGMNPERIKPEDVARTGGAPEGES